MTSNSSSSAGTRVATGDVFLTEYDLAVRWKVSAKKLQADRWHEKGVPFLKIGRAVRYRLAEVISYEERHTVYDLARRRQRNASSEVR